MNMGRAYWEGRGFNNPIYTIAKQMERIQYKLHYNKDDTGEEFNLVAEHPGCQYGSNPYPDFQVPFHPDILPYWEAFAEGQKEREDVVGFHIHSIDLPPSPFFVDNFMPILNSSNATLTSLQLRSCSLDTGALVQVASLLSENTTITTLDISYNKIENMDLAKSLSGAMKKHQLCSANLSGCGIGASVDILSEVLDGCANLQNLCIDNNGIDTEGVVLVLGYLSGNENLTVFSMDGNNLSPDDAKFVIRAMKKTSKVRHLSLGSNPAIHSPKFLDSSRFHENITHLDMSGCGIKLPGAKLIANYLSGNPALTEMNLERNKLALASIRVLADAMSANTTLEHLNLNRNPITDRCVSVLTNLLKNNNTLLSLDLIGSSMKVETGRRQLIRNAVIDTTSLQTIADSNHTCSVSFSKSQTSYAFYEPELRRANALENKGETIRYKVVLASREINKDLFNTRNFDDIPLELMPKLLEISQQEIGYNGFGKGVADEMYKTRSRWAPKDQNLRRIYEVVQGWNTPLLFVVSYMRTYVHRVT